MIFECLAGRHAFDKDNDVAVLVAHLNEAAPSVTAWRPDCPPGLADIVARTLEKSPEDRYQTCEALIEALVAVDLATPALTETHVAIAPTASTSPGAILSPQPEAQAPQPTPAARVPARADPPAIASPSHGRSRAGGSAFSLRRRSSPSRC